jgi:uncharacterized lipoprotein YddW (UPF0748 family)
MDGRELKRGRLQTAVIKRLLTVSVTTLGGVLLAMVSVHSSLEAARPMPQHREAHALWAHPGDAGKSAASVRQFVEQCKRAGIDTIVMLVKGMSGETYWKSRRFPQTAAEGYESFDLLEHLTREAHAQGIMVDAWLCDFVDGQDGAAYREHPEWAQLNPGGGTTATETLGVARRPYPYVWMCPARRPGYTDQWLLPMIEEIATNYQVDNIHHDYVRYPGDVAPDSYCFCDYCLKNIPRFAMLSYDTRVTERYRVNAVQEHIEANWWSDPTMLPIDWPQRDRREMADYLLNGRTIPGGPPDARYFFYSYRVHQIDTFAREVWERVQKINKAKGSRIGVSAAVFKNPIMSGRFIGQQWDEWAPWISIFMPMTYRSHFAGSFDAYLDHLTETTARQLEWISREKPLYAGIATTYLFREEWQPVDDIRDRATELKTLEAKGASGRASKVKAIRESYDAVRARLKPVAPDRERELSRRIEAISPDATTVALDELLKLIAQLRNDPPPGYLPAEKLTRAIEAARKARPDGIVIFVAGSLTREKLWPTLEAAFRK